MRFIVLFALIFTFSAFAQNRVRENIKQQAVSGSESDHREGRPSQPPQKPVKVPIKKK